MPVSEKVILGICFYTRIIFCYCFPFYVFFLITLISFVSVHLSGLINAGSFKKKEREKSHDSTTQVIPYLFSFLNSLVVAQGIM